MLYLYAVTGACVSVCWICVYASVYCQMPVQGDEPSLVVALCNHYNLVFMLYAMCISFSCKFRTNATFACQVLYADLVFVLPYNLPKQIRDSGCVWEHACAFVCLFVCMCVLCKQKTIRRIIFIFNVYYRWLSLALYSYDTFDSYTK